MSAGFVQGAGVSLLCSMGCQLNQGCCLGILQEDGAGRRAESWVGGAAWRSPRGVAAAWWQESSCPFEEGLSHPTTYRIFPAVGGAGPHLSLLGGPLRVWFPLQHPASACQGLLSQKKKKEEYGKELIPKAIIVNY